MQKELPLTSDEVVVRHTDGSPVTDPKFRDFMVRANERQYASSESDLPREPVHDT